jgi:Predicted membrane protein
MVGIKIKQIYYIKERLSALLNEKILLCLINSNLMMVILSILYATQPTSSREYQLNGVSDKVVSGIRSVDDFNKTNILSTFLKGLAILTLIWITFFIVLMIIQHFISELKIQYILLLINITLFALINVYKVHEDLIFNIILSTLAVFVFYYILIKKRVFALDKLEIVRRKSNIILTLAFILYVIIIGGLTVLRYIDFQQQMYDTSIFSQMFYYMSKWGLPFSTIERQSLVSHFAVHFSPIYYILLPGFMIFKTPIYLATAKILLVASGVFPLYKLCKQKGLNNFVSLMISVSYLLFPSLIASSIGDGNGHILNENYFYPALLFWIFYYLEKQNFKALWMFCILMIFVKEDAPIIISCIGLYLILTKKSKFHGLILFIISGIYFIVCSKYIIPHFGSEYLITSYYNNFVPDGELAFPFIIYDFIYKPSYVIQQVFTPGKIIFLLQLVGPLLFLPLIAIKKLRNFVLIIPIILTSLLCINPTYIYELASHHNMAPICICFYLTVIEISQIKSKQQQVFCVLSILLITSIFTTSYNIDKTKYLNYYIENKENIKLINTALSKIPENASVTADPNFTTKLTNRFKLFRFFNTSCDYVAIDLRSVSEDEKKTITDLLLGNEYGVTDYKKNLYLILLKNHSVDRNHSVYSNQFLN